MKTKKNFLKHPACIADHLGWVEISQDHDKVYRYFTRKNKVSTDFLDSDAYKSKEGIFWPKAVKCNKAPNDPVAENYSEDDIFSYEVDKINLVTRYTEFAPRQVLESLIRISEIQAYCLKNNHYIGTHIWNIVLKEGQPLLIDLGDFFKCDELLRVLPAFNTVRESIMGTFIGEITNHSPTDLRTVLENCDQIFLLLENVSLQYYGQLQYCTDLDTSKELLLSYMDKVKQILSTGKVTTQPGYWSDYDKIKWSNPEQIPDLYGHKSKVLCDFIKDKKPKTFFDIGCNAGIYSFYAAHCGSECVGQDTDLECIERANALAFENQQNCSFVSYDIMNPPPAYGLEGVYGSPAERFKSEMVVAPAVYHHLSKQGHSTISIVQELIKYSTKYACLEFIPHSDIIEDPINQRAMSEIKEVFNKNGFNVEVKDSYPNPRKWFIAEKV